MKQPVLIHENKKAWKLMIEAKDDQGESLDLTGWEAKAQLRSKLNNRLFATLTLTDGLSYTHPNLTLLFTAEQLNAPPGQYTIGLEFTAPGSTPMDTVLINVELIKLFIPA